MAARPARRLTRGRPRIAGADAARFRLSRAAIEARAARSLDTLPVLAKLPPGSELSTRQTEIVTRLVPGQSQAEIAAAMYLSPGTVRNHLATIYRKFAVHSQSQLLAALVRASAEHG